MAEESDAMNTSHNENELVDIALSARVLRFSDASVTLEPPPSTAVSLPEEQQGIPLGNIQMGEFDLDTSTPSLAFSGDSISQVTLPPGAPVMSVVSAPPLPTAGTSLAQTTPVEVYVRVRPLNGEERGRAETSTITVDDDRTLITTAPAVCIVYLTRVVVLSPSF